MKILLTGAGGFIGSRLVRKLAGKHAVYGSVRLLPDNVDDRVHWIQGDLRNLKVKDLPSDAEVIAHFAQSAHYSEFPEQAMDIFEVNVQSTVELLEYGRTIGIKQFVYASSGGIYGHSNRKFTEDDTICTGTELGFYYSTKYCSELLVEGYRDYFTTIILRPFYVYGREGRSQMLIPRLINSVREGNPIFLSKENGIRLNPIYIDDAVEVIVRCLNLNEHHKLNVAGKEILTMRQIGEIIGEVLGIKPKFTSGVSTSGDLIGDIRKMERLLGYSPQVSFREGIRRICLAKKDSI